MSVNPLFYTFIRDTALLIPRPAFRERKSTIWIESEKVAPGKPLNQLKKAFVRASKLADAIARPNIDEDKTKVVSKSQLDVSLLQMRSFRPA